MKKRSIFTIAMVALAISFSANLFAENDTTSQIDGEEVVLVMGDDNKDHTTSSADVEGVFVPD